MRGLKIPRELGVIDGGRVGTGEGQLPPSALNWLAGRNALGLAAYATAAALETELVAVGSKPEAERL